MPCCAFSVLSVISKLSIEYAGLLFTTDELLGTFQEAGLHVEYDPKGLTDRGLYVARVAA